MTTQSITIAHVFKAANTAFLENTYPALPESLYSPVLHKPSLYYG